VIYSLGDKKMQSVDGDYYVAPGAQVIGSVRFGRGVSVWFNCVVRADNDWIDLGDGTNIQDGTIIHTDKGVPVTLGSNVSVGHRALLHGCTVGDTTLIANGAIVLDRVSIGRECLIAAGTLVPPGKVIPDRSVVMGAPGKIVREVNAQDLEINRYIAEHYQVRGRYYRRNLLPCGRNDESASA
jgi:carbonic anhydrase/acetyltransferase-like protein (isoleucine patch superfamily)